MNIISIYRLVFYLCICVICHFYVSANEISSYHDDLYQVLDSFADKMNQELHLRNNGFDANNGMFINKINLHFTAKRRATIEEARAITIYLISNLVKKLNKNEKLHRFFVEYPLSHKYIFLQLDFLGPQGTFCDGSVSFMGKVTASSTESHRQLYYCASDPFSDKGIVLYEENYEEAIEKFASSSLKFPYDHKTTDIEAATDQIFDEYIDEMSQERELIRWNIGGLLTGSVEKIGVIFTYYQSTQLEQSRELLTFATERLIKAINKSEKLKPYLLDKPFTDKRVRLEIRFRDNRYLDFHDGSIESVVLDNSQVTYSHEENAHHEDYPDLKEVKPFLWESYQEALEKSHVKDLVN